MPIPSAPSGFPPEKRHLVGVSGGRDSVALLHWLASNGLKKLVVCHLDHGLREQESAIDANFVRDLADQFGLPTEMGTAHLDSATETAARDARYEFFAEAAAKHHTSKIFLAHHADDQAETILLNLCRGAGARGLSGMKSKAKRTVKGVELTILRPWLKVTRAEIDDYIAQHELPFREDPTNSDPDFTARNRLRAELARALGRDITPAILRTSELLRADDDALESLVTEAWGNLVDEEKRLRTTPLRELTIALQRRVIRRWLRLQHGLSDIGFNEVETVLSLLGPPESSPAKVNLPGKWHIRRKEGRIFAENGAN